MTAAAPEIRVALAGNPNVGKSTIFNSLTGMRTHTGNWPGKTVEIAEGVHSDHGCRFLITDLPGCYSLDPHSPEEEVARDFLLSGQPHVAAVVCDASLLERSLILALQIIDLFPKTMVVLNLIDEAEKHGITVDADALSRELGVPVVCTSAANGKGVKSIPAGLLAAMEQKPPVGNSGVVMADMTAYVARAEAISHKVTSSGGEKSHKPAIADRILAGSLAGFPAMALLLLGVMWLTVVGANYPSEILSGAFTKMGTYLRDGLTLLGMPTTAVSCIVDGVYLTVSWVVSVMLPPMAIFFPLFTILEDLGYLPRMAFCLDRIFKGCGSCGKQSLTMCMGLGCNAAGVTGCRIIDSERERRIAILTNSMMPCNGRFPGMICLAAIFFAASEIGTALCLTLVIAVGAGATFLTSKILSSTVFKGVPSSFALELPPYRIPKIGQTLLRSLLDKTLFVLGRAVSVAAPAGLVIWLLSNITAGDTTILVMMAETLDPVGRILGMDGVIITAFILALPANEIVLPLAAMGYMSAGIITDVGQAELGALLTGAGWTPWTAAAVIAFSLFHWPCSTTLITVKKETGSTKMMLLAAVLPTIWGIALCLIINGARMIFTG